MFGRTGAWNLGEYLTVANAIVYSVPGSAGEVGKEITSTNSHYARVILDPLRFLQQIANSEE